MPHVHDVYSCNQECEYNEKKGYEHYPLQYMQLEATPIAASDLTTCLRRDRCRPIGGNNIQYVTPFKPSDDPTAAPPPVYGLFAQLDARALIPDLSLGVGSQMAGLITALTLVDTLTYDYFLQPDTTGRILFALFDAERWGLTGSARYFADLATRTRPTAPTSTQGTNPVVRLDDLDTAFELHHVAGEAGDTGTTTYHVFYDRVPPTRPAERATAQRRIDQLVRVNAYLAALPADARPLAMRRGPGTAWDLTLTTTATPHLPPETSVQSLLRRRRVPALVLSDHPGSYRNRYYGSVLDDASLLATTYQYDQLCQLAHVHAVVLYLLTHGVDETMVGLSDAALADAIPASLTTNCTLVGACRSWCRRKGLDRCVCVCR